MFTSRVRNWKYKILLSCSDKVFVKKGCNVTATHQCLVAVYGYSAQLLYSNEMVHRIQMWPPVSGMTSNAMNPIIIAVTDRLIMADWRVSVTYCRRVKNFSSARWKHSSWTSSYVKGLLGHFEISISTIGINTWPHAKSFWICTQVTKKSSVVELSHQLVELWQQLFGEFFWRTVCG